MPYLKSHYRIIRFDNRGVDQADMPNEAYGTSTIHMSVVEKPHDVFEIISGFLS